MSDLINRQAAIQAIDDLPNCYNGFSDTYDKAQIIGVLEELPSVQPEGWVKIPDTGIDDLSDGFHTFRQLYYQRMMLFATIVRQNREKAWKSLRHEDGELCFGGGWFIVGIDTPEGSYTYHYEDKFFDLFDCVELTNGKEWDGHTEKDVTRLLSLPSVQPEQKHGYWIVTDIPNLTSTAQDVVTFTRQCRCSECGAMFGRKSDKYCYNCGIRMEGETE